MNGYQDEIVTEVRRNRAKLLEMHGGMEGLQKYMKGERPQLEKEGWRFVSTEEFNRLNKSNMPENSEFRSYAKFQLHKKYDRLGSQFSHIPPLRYHLSPALRGKFKINVFMFLAVQLQYFRGCKPDLIHEQV
jgi:hypothetical protein